MALPAALKEMTAMKKLNLLWVLALFFLFGNLGSIIWVICENDKERVWESVPVLGFFVIGGCITGIILVEKERRQRMKEGELPK